MTTETSEARSDDHQVFCYIIKQLWTFQLLYMMLICTKKIIIDLGYLLGQIYIFFGAYHIMYNSLKVHNCIILVY